MKFTGVKLYSNVVLIKCHVISTIPDIYKMSHFMYHASTHPATMHGRFHVSYKFPN